MNTQQAIKGIIQYCYEQIDDFKLRADLAISKSWRERCPIENASFSLANQVSDCISEYCEDNDCNELYDEITVEDILLNM